MRRRTPKDHSALELKLLLRTSMLSLAPPGRVVDLFAGAGQVLTAVYRDYPELHAVEKDPLKLKILEQRARELKMLSKLTIHPGDNKVFAEHILPRLGPLRVIEMDAYGNPHPLLFKVLENARLAERALIFLTDGGRMSLLRRGRVRPASYFPELPSRAEPSPEGASARFPLLSPGEYELLVRGLWRRLAKLHGFKLAAFRAAWPRSRRVLYYGVCIQKDGNRVD